MPPIVRPVRETELTAWFTSVGIAFLNRQPVDGIAAEVATHWDLSRAHAAWDAGVLCGTYRSWRTELTVPGGTGIPGGAVSGVTVRPTHRRRGVLRAMMDAGLGVMRERGEAVALLYASEAPIYGRFGFGVGTMAATVRLDTRGLGMRGAAGGVEIIEPDRDVLTTVRGVYERWRASQPGEIWRRDITWELDLGLRPDPWGGPWKGILAVHRDGTGHVDGYVRYTPEGKWEQQQPKGAITVDDLHALTPDAYAALWRFLVEMDLTVSITAERRGPDERIRWLISNSRAAQIGPPNDALWVRLLDVPAALESRAYEREGRAVLELVDPIDGSRQRYRLDVTPDGARCRPSRASADLTIDVGALGAAFLGGTRLSDAVLVSGVEEHRAGSLREATRLFATVDAPATTTFF